MRRAGCGEALPEQGEGFSGAAKLPVLQELLSAPFSLPSRAGSPESSGAGRAGGSSAQAKELLFPFVLRSLQEFLALQTPPRDTVAALAAGILPALAAPRRSQEWEGRLKLAGSSSRELEPANQGDELSHPAAVPS